MPATLPWPKIPKQPAKNCCSLPSRTTYWFLRKRMIAWATVRDFTFMVILNDGLSKKERHFNVKRCRSADHPGPDKFQQATVTANELIQRMDGGAVVYKLSRLHPLFVISLPEISESRIQFVHDLLANRYVDPGLDFHGGSVEPVPPFVRHADDNFPPDELGPVHVVPVRRGQQRTAAFPLLEAPVCFFEGRHSSPLDIAGVNCDIVFRRSPAQLVVQAT